MTEQTQTLEMRTTFLEARIIDAFKMLYNHENSIKKLIKEHEVK